jgi:hypothetical protein
MPTPERQSLRLAETVEENFSFLAAHGLKRVQSGPTFVRFESRRAYVNVYHGRRSFELGLEVGPIEAKGVEEAPFSMSEIVRLLEPEKADGHRNFATHTADGVHEGVRRLASLFRGYVEAGLLSDPGLFGRLERQRAAWSQSFARNVNLTQARRKLDAAWHARDYAKVVEPLEPLRADLTPSELKKLALAKKRLQEAS